MALKDKLMTLEDFKAVRDVDVASNSAQFTEIKADLDNLEPGLSNEAKAALMACIRNSAWGDENGSDYYVDLADALDFTMSKVIRVLNRKAIGTATVYNEELVKIGTLAGVLVADSTARCRFNSPIKNNGYVIAVTDSEKYNVAVFGLVDNIVRDYITNKSTLVMDRGYLCAASTSPSYAPSMTANGAYIYASFKKMDGTDFTEDEINNAVGTIFVIGKQMNVCSWSGVDNPGHAQKWVNKDAVIGIKDPAELALVNGYSIDSYYNWNNKLYGATPIVGQKRATSLTQVVIGNLDGKTIHFTSYTLSSGATIAFAVYYLYINPSTGSFDALQYVELGDNSEFVYMAWNENDLLLPTNNSKIGVRALMLGFKITNADRDFTAAELREIPTLIKIR